MEFEQQPGPQDSRQGESLADIGRTYELRGDLAAAEQCYRQGVALGSAAAMDRLARMLHDRIAGQGRLERWRNRARNRDARLEAGMLLRVAATAGNPQAMAALGALLDEQGEGREAEYWYRQAITGGEDSAMNNLGLLLYRRGDHAGARQWWTRAARAGSSAAMRNLSKLPIGPLAPFQSSHPTAPIPSGNYAYLLTLVMGNRSTADDLIEFERQQTPQVPRHELIRRAIDRLHHDRNR